MKIFPYKIVDLTHTLDENIPTWSGQCGFQHVMNLDYDPKAPYKFRTHKIYMDEGIGTHLDAPAHCCEDGQTVEEIPLADLMAPCVVIDVSQKAHKHFRVYPEDIQQFETLHGPIPEGSFVMIRTGWERFWNQPEKYRNNYFFPSVSKEAADILLESHIKGLGIDTLSPDRPEDDYPVHQALLNSGKYIVENVANLTHLPPQGSFVWALPMKIGQGTEAPIRLVGFIHKE